MYVAKFKSVFIVGLLLASIAVCAEDKNVTTLQQAVQQLQSNTTTQSKITNAVQLYKSGALGESEVLAALIQVLGVDSPSIADAVTELIRAGANAAIVTSAAVSAGTNANVIVNAAIAAGADANTVVAAAISAGADPTTITASTAAGPANNAASGFLGNGLPSFTIPPVTPAPANLRAASRS